jgi:hypothetical protein
VDRLLCCDQKLFTGLAAQSCGSGFVNELLVVHNNDKYGGSGGKGMGTTSVNQYSPQVPSAAARCNAVRHAAMAQHAATQRNMLQHGATCCNTAQHAGSQSVNPVLANSLQEPSRRNQGFTTSVIQGPSNRDK